MKKTMRILSLLTLLVLITAFDSFAMANKENNYGIITSRPENEEKNEKGKYQYIWTWLNDDLCVQTNGTEKIQKREWIQKKYDLGLVDGWMEKGQVKTRETYTGKWSQSEDGVWSFRFDDHTIPIEIAKIDDVLYAFNGYGELMEGYEYYDGLTTGADGLVTSEDPAFLEWLETQYVPECFTQQEETEETEAVQ